MHDQYYPGTVKHLHRDECATVGYDDRQSGRLDTENEMREYELPTAIADSNIATTASNIGTARTKQILTVDKLKVDNAEPAEFKKCSHTSGVSPIYNTTRKDSSST